MNHIAEKSKFLTGNQLKLIAMITMTCDHVGLQLLPQLGILRIIGRLSFPIYAYMIAEGCRYTRNRKKHLLSITVLAVLCQIVFFVAEGSLFQSILVTFSLSIGLIYLIDRAKAKRTAGGWIAAILFALLVFFASVVLKQIMPGSLNYGIDYGIWGILLPVAIYYAADDYKLPVMMVALLPLCLSLGGNQWYCYLAVLLLACYSGKRGKANIKNLFYIYYPAHLVVIYLISLL